MKKETLKSKVTPGIVDTVSERKVKFMDQSTEHTDQKSSCGTALSVEIDKNTINIDD
jgi:hypothetical protein